MSDELTISFLLSCAALAGFEAMKAAGWRIWAFGAISTAFLVAGFAWHWVKEIYPPFTTWITELATSPQSWFVLIVIALVLISITGRRHKHLPTVLGADGSFSWFRELLHARATENTTNNEMTNPIEAIDARIAAFEQKIVGRFAEQLETNRILAGMIGKIEDKADRIGPAVQEIKNQAENDRKVATRGYQLIVKSLRAGPGILHRTISGVSA